MKELLEIGENGLTLGGKDFYLASGEMHYFRFFKDGWERRLKLMKAFGLNTVQTYVPWNLHEKEEGCFDFSGNLDIAAFIRLCGEIGLKVLLRPSPYMCSEWDFGGLPWWLLKNADVKIRCLDDSFMLPVERYMKRLCEEFVPLLSTNGGPIIAVAVENEYGSFANDSDYIRRYAELMRENGVDVPLYTADGTEQKHITWGSVPELWTCINTSEISDGNKEMLDAFNGKKMARMVCEQWVQCTPKWGGKRVMPTAENVAAAYKKSLEAGYFVNFYMFCAGTNYGFMNGAFHGPYSADVPNAKWRYNPYVTSYDGGAPINEYGEPTQNYYALKKVLAEYLNKKSADEAPVKVKTASYGTVPLKESAPLFSNLDAIASSKVISKATKTMEELSQGYGFILYEAFIKHTDDGGRLLRIEDLHDRATVYKNGKYIGSMYRDRDDYVTFKVPREGMKLSILVENMGRINFGSEMIYERKGITHCVRLDRVGESGTVYRDPSMILDWTIRTLPMEDLSLLSYGASPKENMPAFYKGSFSANEKADTFIRINGGTKGFIRINGFNLGRYWSIGPQETLYVPAELLKDENTVEIFELYAPASEISAELLSEPSINTLKENIDVITQAPIVIEKSKLIFD